MQQAVKLWPNLKALSTDSESKPQHVQLPSTCTGNSIFLSLAEILSALFQPIAKTVIDETTFVNVSCLRQMVIFKEWLCVAIYANCRGWWWIWAVQSRSTSMTFWSMWVCVGRREGEGEAGRRSGGEWAGLWSGECVLVFILCSVSSTGLFLRKHLYTVIAARWSIILYNYLNFLVISQLLSLQIGYLNRRQVYSVLTRFYNTLAADIQQTMLNPTQCKMRLFGFRYRYTFLFL